MRLTAAGVALGSMPGARMNRALLFSLLIHALLLSLTFGQGFGLPGLSLPWQTRRVEAPDLRVVLSPAVDEAGQAAVPPPPLERSAAPVAADAAAAEKTLAPVESVGEVLPPPDAGLAPIAVDRPAAWAVPAASAVPSAVVAALSAASSPAVEPLRQMGDALRVRSVEPAPPDVSRPEARPLPSSVVAAFASASSPAVEPLRRDALRTVDRDARERTTELAQLDGARQDTQRKAEQLEAARVEALRQEAARAEAARRDAARLEATRLEALRQEAARLEGERQEAARQATAQQEATRQEAARQDAARAEAGRQEAARQEAGRQEAARQAAARLEAGRIEAARLAAAQAEAEQREARLRAIGKQLDEEAAKRDAQREAERKRPDWAPARRGRLFGRSDANQELVLYAEAFARKIQLNQTMEMVREAAQQPHVDPVVTVAVRSDGSVESVTFVRSSGVPAIDDAVRRIVLSQERYQAFQPALLRDFDVVEIRRSWHFDVAIRLY